MKRQISIFWVIAVLLTVSLSIISCSKTGYKVFTMKEGIAKFSFEKGSRYKVKEYYSHDNITAVHVRGPFNKEANDYTLIDVIVVPTKLFYPDAESAINDLIRKRSGDSVFEFKVLEQGDLMVAGIPAKLIVYKERDLTRAIAEMYANNDSLKVAYEVCREIDFVYNDLLWTLSIDSDVSTAEVDKTDFEHVIQTFKIIELQSPRPYCRMRLNHTQEVFMLKPKSPQASFYGSYLYDKITDLRQTKRESA